MHCGIAKTLSSCEVQLMPSNTSGKSKKFRKEVRRDPVPLR